MIGNALAVAMLLLMVALHGSCVVVLMVLAIHFATEGQPDVCIMAGACAGWLGSKWIDDVMAIGRVT